MIESFKAASKLLELSKKPTEVRISVQIAE